MEQVSLPKWLSFSQMHPVDYYSTFTKNCSGNFSEQEIRDVRVSYYAMCAETDSMLGKQIVFNISSISSNLLCLMHCIRSITEIWQRPSDAGAVIGALRDTGLLNSTVLLFTSDHGDLAMEHRQFYKMSMFEGSSHVPLLMMGPGIKSGIEISLPVSLVDLYPSVLGEFTYLLMCLINL